jgi:hypothetical protein
LMAAAVTLAIHLRIIVQRVRLVLALWVERAAQSMPLRFFVAR